MHVRGCVENLVENCRSPSSRAGCGAERACARHLAYRPLASKSWSEGSGDELSTSTAVAATVRWRAAAYVRSISYEAAGFWKLSEQGNKGERLAIASSQICLEELNTRGDDNRMPAPACHVLASAKVGSKSFATRTSIISASTATVCTADLAAANCAALSSGMPTITAREPGDDLFEQPYLFPAQLRKIKKHSCEIAARTRKTFDIPFGRRIALQIKRNNRNAGRCITGRDNRPGSCCESDAYVATNQITRILT
jgi:hypothetical protein